MSEAEARGLFKPKLRCSIAPPNLTRVGIWVAVVSCAGPGRPFVVTDRERKRCSILPRWDQAASAMVDIARDYEAAVREHGDARISGRKDGARGRNIHSPRKPTEGVRLNPQRRREVIAVFRRTLAVPTRSPLTSWEVGLAEAILDVLNSRKRGLSEMEADHTDRLMAKITGCSR